MTINSYSAKTGRILLEDGSYLNEADFWSDLRSPFGSLQTIERTPIIELLSVYGLSALRDKTTVAGSATVTHAGAALASEYVLTTTASGTDRAVLDSAERGRYQPGASAQSGIGVRLDAATRTGSQESRWGYYDDNDGFFFGLDATGFFIAVRNGGSDTKVYQSAFNDDKMDGTGTSGLTLDLTLGRIFQVDFSWYGYGTIQFGVISEDADGIQQKYVLHRFNRSVAGTSTENPNLPIRAEALNGGTATAHVMYVAGRQFSILGPFIPSRRINGHYRSAALTGIGATFVPVVSFRRKASFDSVSAKVEGFDMLAGHDLYWQLRVNGTLTGASFGTPADTTAAETAFEVDTAATAITGGEVLNAGGIIVATTNQAKILGQAIGLGVEIPGTQIVTLCVRRISGTAGTVDGAVLRWAEEW